jgi:hypothetical protein
MTAALIAQFMPYALAAIGGFAVFLGVRRSGANAAWRKIEKARMRGLEDRLEMNREADARERDNAAMADAVARKKATRVIR